MSDEDQSHPYSKYRGVLLVTNDACVLEELERTLQEPLPKLETVSPNSTEQQTEPPRFFGFYVEKNQIVGLFLEGKNLKHFPRVLSQCSALQVLHLNNNPGIEVPTWLNEILSLQKLSLVNNQLASIPELGALRRLRELNLSSNELNSLPASFFQLTNLQMLSLADNNFTSLPDSFGQLENLQKLWLYKNQLTALPESIRNLVNLQILVLEGNPLASLPESLKMFFLKLREKGCSIYGIDHLL